MLRLAQRLGAGEDVIAARVPLLLRGAPHHGRDVVLVDRCGLACTVRPPDDVALTDRGPHQNCAFDENPRAGNAQPKHEERATCNPS